MKFLPITTTQTYHSTCRGSTPVTEIISMRIWFPFICILVILRVQCCCSVFKEVLQLFTTQDQGNLFRSVIQLVFISIHSHHVSSSEHQ
jgi:hypothetical protein